MNNFIIITTTDHRHRYKLGLLVILLVVIAELLLPGIATLIEITAMAAEATNNKTADSQLILHQRMLSFKPLLGSH
jgi:hypothetical protein